MVRLNHVRFAGGGSGGFDHVRIDGALRQPFHLLLLAGFFVEHFNEHAADNFTLGFRFVHARQCGQEAVFRLNVNDVQAEVVAEHFHHLLGFVQAQQAVVDKHAGQALADGAVQQHRGDGGVNAAGQAEDHVVFTHLLADALDRIFDNGGRRPQGFTLADVQYEALQHALA